LQHAAVAHLGRIVRFNAPDRRNRVAIDAIGFLDRIELRLVGRKDFPPACKTRIADKNIQIIPYRLGEFRL